MPVCGMKFTEIAFVAYPVIDMKESRTFYEDLLGFVPTMVSEHSEDVGWVEYELAGQAFAIVKAPGMDPSVNGPICGLECEDLDANLAELKAAGVKIAMEKMETPVCHMAVILDPAGNSLIIHKRKPGHA